MEYNFKIWPLASGLASAGRAKRKQFASDITRVPCGRTDVLIGGKDAPSPEHSYGHGLDSASFQGLFVSKVWNFFIFATTWERKVETNGSGL